MSRRPVETGPHPRVGIFGLIGSGNRGNDASFEVVLDHLRAEHPDAAVSVMCPAVDDVAGRYGVSTFALNWNRSEYRTAAGWSLVTKTVGKVVDLVRTLAWVRRQDMVVVPGMGVLEASLPVRPWGFPYSLLLLSVAGRLLKVPVVLIAVGADVVRHSATRQVLVAAARLAHRRSYRDMMTRDAMRAMGVDVSRDAICPDLVFAIARPRSSDAASGEVVGVGVMEYGGSNDDRHDADRIRNAYVGVLFDFVCWLLDHDRAVCLLTGDEVDDIVVEEICSRVRADRPDLDPQRVVADRSRSTGELLGRISRLQAMVGTRYHSVLCALRLSVPTLSIGYSAKHAALMAGMGVGEFHQLAGSLDLQLLVQQFEELERRRDEVVGTLDEHSRAHAVAVEAHLRSVFKQLA